MKPSTHKKNRGLFEKVYSIVKKIPEGKVATYGQLAKMLDLRDVRKIGWALHANRDPKCPCHRVVNKDGFVAKSYAFGGQDEQKARLTKEGVKFSSEYGVDLDMCLWKKHNKEFTLLKYLVVSFFTCLKKLKKEKTPRKSQRAILSGTNINALIRGINKYSEKGSCPAFWRIFNLFCGLLFSSPGVAI